MAQRVHIIIYIFINYIYNHNYVMHIYKLLFTHSEYNLFYNVVIVIYLISVLIVLLMVQVFFFLFRL